MNGYSLTEADLNRILNHGGFCEQWAMSDMDGCRVAHIAARYGRLPLDFNQWDLADKSGWSVAHEAAWYDKLPAGFDQWELADKSGLTVRDVIPFCQ